MRRPSATACSRRAAAPAPGRESCGRRSRSAIALLDLRPQLSRPGAGAAALLEHAVALGLRIRQLGRRLGELLEALPEILPVPGAHLELSVEQRADARGFRPERPLAGGTRALRAELHDLVALLFHFFVLFEQLGALGLGVLPVAYPHRALLLRGPLDRLQPLVQFARRGIRPGQGLRDVTELGEAALERSEEHTSELQSRLHLVCRLLLEKKNTTTPIIVRKATNSPPAPSPHLSSSTTSSPTTG